MMQNQPARAGAGVEWFHPGEVVIVARVRRGTFNESQLHDRLRGMLSQHARGQVRADPDALRSYVFDAPGESQSLAFFVQQLENRRDVRAVKDAVEALHGQMDTLGGGDLDILGAMPHWHVRAHEMSSGGSPGSFPAPVYPDEIRRHQPKRRVYRPKRASLNPKAGGGEPVPVAVLDTRIDLQQARARAERFKNVQMLETIDAMRLVDDSASGDDFEQVARHQADLGGLAPFEMPDHGLFVSGLIHGISPSSEITYVPVLNELGVGDLSLLLIALRRVLDAKPAEQPQIINLSLGFRPHPAHLPSAWYGLPRNDPTYTRAQVLFNPDRDERWVHRNRAHVRRTVDLLQAGLGELARYLRLNNCLVVAAAGNDSVAGHARLEPRLPARFDSVLGVAATTGDDQPAPYSNLGDEGMLGDHVATFGGSVNADLQPRDGVIGIYSGDFPNAQANETGWAYWSGTSFATAIVSGIAANVWAQQSDRSVADVMDELHAEADAEGDFVSELRTPAIEVRGEWES